MSSSGWGAGGHRALVWACIDQFKADMVLVVDHCFQINQSNLYLVAAYLSGRLGQANRI